MLWFMGDSIVEQAVKDFAGEQTFESTAIPDATPEQVWTEQKHFGRRRWTEPPTVVCFINSLDYDSEGTMWHILSMIPKESTVFFLYLPSEKVKEGLAHYPSGTFTPVEIASTEHNEVLEKLLEAQG